MIPQRNISLLSNRLARAGGRRIPETVLERDYCLAWFLAGLSLSPLREVLAFKSGTALKRCYFFWENPRLCRWIPGEPLTLRSIWRVVVG
jgi:hypothetical protein